MIAKSFGFLLVLLGVVGLGATLIDWSTLEGQWASEEIEQVTTTGDDDTPPDVAAVTETNTVDALPAPAEEQEPVLSDEPESAPVDHAELTSDSDPEPTPANDTEENIRPTKQEENVSAIADRDSGSVKVFDRADQGSSDALPSVDITAGNESFSEDSDHVNFVLTLSEPVERPIIIIFSTVDGSARSDEDYLSQRGTVTFKPGIVSAEIRTPLVDDQVSEGDEQFAMVLNGAPGIVNLKNRRAQAVIIDND